MTRWSPNRPDLPIFSIVFLHVGSVLLQLGVSDAAAHVLVEVRGRHAGVVQVCARGVDGQVADRGLYWWPRSTPLGRCRPLWSFGLGRQLAQLGAQRRQLRLGRDTLLRAP